MCQQCTNSDTCHPFLLSSFCCWCGEVLVTALYCQAPERWGSEFLFGQVTCFSLHFQNGSLSASPSNEREMCAVCVKCVHIDHPTAAENCCSGIRNDWRDWRLHRWLLQLNQLTKGASGAPLMSQDKTRAWTAHCNGHLSWVNTVHELHIGLVFLRKQPVFHLVKIPNEDNKEHKYNKNYT